MASFDEYSSKSNLLSQYGSRTWVQEIIATPLQHLYQLIVYLVRPHKINNELIIATYLV